jgi:hypothetical protein
MLAHISDKVHSGLEVDTFLVHNHGNHIVCIAFRLFDVIGKDVLEKERDM